MQQVYVTRTLPDVYLVREYLEAEGVPTEIRNEHLFGAQGEVPVTADTLPSLWADDEHVLRARQLIEAHRNTDGAEAAAALDAMEGDASPEAHAAMSDLFVAADRLSGGSDGAHIDEVRHLSAIIDDSAAPFGIDPPLWDRIAGAARQITSAAAEGDDHRVAATATQLRDLLRDLV